MKGIIILCILLIGFTACSGSSSYSERDYVDQVECETNIVKALQSKSGVLIKEIDLQTDLRRIGEYDSYYQVSSYVGSNHESARYSDYDTTFQVYRLDYEQGVGFLAVDKEMYFVCDRSGLLLK